MSLIAYIHDTGVFVEIDALLKMYLSGEISGTKTISVVDSADGYIEKTVKVKKMFTEP